MAPAKKNSSIDTAEIFDIRSQKTGNFSIPAATLRSLGMIDNGNKILHRFFHVDVMDAKTLQPLYRGPGRISSGMEFGRRAVSKQIGGHRDIRVIISRDESPIDKAHPASKMKRPKGWKQPQSIKTITISWYRCPLVNSYVIERSKGKCERCGVVPFLRENGTVFLEVHHLNQLSNLGEDTVENCAAVCPNCHRFLHYGHGRETETKKLRKMIAHGDLS